MNSLDFIKMHVDDWPNISGVNSVILFYNGDVVFGDNINGTTLAPIHHVDLSEHFAPDYHDGKLWSREEFEACGSALLESSNSWTPTINSIVDVGDCEGVVKGFDGEHYWVLKDSGMYDTYHKDYLSKPKTSKEILLDSIFELACCVDFRVENQGDKVLFEDLLSQYNITPK